MTTSIQKDALLSQFSVLAYKSADFLSDPANLPIGWSMKLANDKSPPFAAFAFKNDTTGEVIIAYRGTDGIKDASADAAILAGTWDSQFKQGLDFAKSVRDNQSIFPDGPETSKIFVTGHSLGGAIAQIVAYAFGFDGSTIDPGAAARIVQTRGFLDSTAELSLSPANFGLAASFTNYLVAGSIISGGTGDHLGLKSSLPSLTFSGEQALKSFLIGMVNPVAGIAYAIGTDQGGNKHSSEQVSQALNLLAGNQNNTNGTVGILILTPKIIGTIINNQTGEITNRYSQTEFEIKDTNGVLLSTVKFSGSGATRQIEEFNVDTTLKSTTTITPTGTVTVQPVIGGTTEVSYLPILASNQDELITTTKKDSLDNLIQTITRQTDDNGNTLVITTNADGSGTAKTFDDTGAEIASASFNKTGGINGTTGTLTEDVNGRTVVLDVNFNDGGGDADGDGVMDRNEAGYDLHSSIDLTGINSIGGQPVVNDSSLDAALNAANLDLADMWAGNGAGSGTFNQLINAGDASNPDGYTEFTPPAGVAWYQTPEAQQFGNTLTDIQGLISALKSGQPLPIATSLFNMASHLSRHILQDENGDPIYDSNGNPQLDGGDATLADISGGLNLISSVIGFRDALKRGDPLGSLVAAGSLASNALPNKRFKSCKRSSLRRKFDSSRRINCLRSY